MLEKKINYFIERATIVAICLWGNWAIYYWIAVLIFDASYINLKAFIPILILQIFLSLFFLLRTDLSFTSVNNLTCIPAKRYPGFILGIPFYVLSASVTLFAVIIALAADHFHWTRSPLSYNLFWAMLLPVSLAYLFYSKVSSSEAPAQVFEEENRSNPVDSMLFLLVVMAMAFTLYGTGFPTPDDGFTGHVISSTIANPALPIQGQDLLLNTTAPYSLHPSYRVVGIEVLVALLSEALGLNPLQVYFDVLPVVGVILLSLAAHMFMRAFRVPYPGLAVTVYLLTLLFMANGNFQSVSLRFLHFGKSLVMTTASPLLFFAVAAFMRSQSIQSWVLLLLAVCSVVIWSSTALFIVPLCVGLASIVFLPSIRGGIPVLFSTFLSLTPIFLLLVYCLLVLQQAPVNAVSDVLSTGFLKVNGESFGGLYAKAAILMIVLVLPVIARTIADAKFQTTILRVCMVGIFTVMAPYILESIAILTNLNLLAGRLTSSYPSALLIGVIASIAVTHLNQWAPTTKAAKSKYVVLCLVLVSYGTLFSLIDIGYTYGESRKSAKEIYDAHFNEALAARQYIPKDSVVAAGVLDDVLPMLPNPPSFISVRHYLDYHKYSLSENEFSSRQYLYNVLKNRLPRKGDSLETTMDLIISTASEIEVDTVIFLVFSGYGSSEPDAEKAKFISTLTARLKRSGYECSTTASGRTRVCNRL